MNVCISKYFDKRFSKLPNKVQQKTLERIQLFRIEPNARILRNHGLTGKWTGYRSIDVTGDYRAVYMLVQDNMAKFYTVDTHSNLYG